MKIGAHLRKIIPVRPEVIVDDIEDHHQSALMRGIDQGFQILRPPIAGVRRKEQHAVVTPVPAARKVRDRHEFDRGDAEVGKCVELVDCRAERPSGVNAPT